MMQSYTGQIFDPMNLEPWVINIRDIAHHLSQICRYGGATREHYSVAEHSLLMSYALPDGLKLVGLLHDAHEAYIGDMAWPIKQKLGAIWQNVEVMAELAVISWCSRTSLDHWHPLVAEYDRRIVLDETAELAADPAYYSEHPSLRELSPLGVQIEAYSPERAEFQFLARYVELGGSIDD